MARHLPSTSPATFPRVNSEVEQLNEYRGRLTVAREQLDTVTREVRALEQIVAGLETLAGEKKTGRLVEGVAHLRADSHLQAHGTVIRRGSETADEDDGASAERKRSRAPRGVPEVVKEIMADGVERTFDEVMELVEQHPKFKDHPPARSSVSNRLGEFAGDGYLTRPTPNTFKLASPNGAQASVESPGLDLRERQESP